MSTKIIFAALATLAIGTAAQAATMSVSHIPTITPPRPVIVAPRPVVNAPAVSGLTRMTSITHPGNFTKDTSVFTNQSGKVVMAISSISSNPAPVSTPPGTLAPKGVLFTRTPSGAIASVTLIGGYAPGGSTTTPALSVPQNGTAPSSAGFGGSGLSQNTTNSHNSTQGHNITNTPTAVQAHQGKNCTVWLHQNGVC